MSKEEWSGFKANRITKLTGAYVIKPQNSSDVYVGSTGDMTQRLRQHKYELRQNNHHCKGLQKIYDETPKLHVEFIEIKETNDLSARELAFNKEQELLNEYSKTGCLLNASIDARNSAAGIVFNDEVRQKMSEKAKIRMNTTEMKLANSNRTKGLWNNEEYKNRLTELRNKPEHKLLQSEDKKKLWENPEHRAKICNPIIINNVSYESVTEASRILNIPKSTLVHRCKSEKFVDYLIVAKKEK